MKAFQYTTARNAADAVEAAGRGKYLAGGIDLLGEMKEYIAQPELLINVKTLPGTQEIAPGRDAWTIGANVTVAAVASHAELRRTFPGLAEAADEVGSPQIRNVATIAGNLAQHSRCWYYRHRDIVCLKRGGATCFAREGENKYHSLFTGNPCISPVVSNLATALAALDARVVVRRGKGEATLSIAELYSKAWDDPTAHNSLGSTDLILRVQVPNQSRRSAYLQVSEKAAFDWALVSCATSAKVSDGKLSDAHVVLGSVAPMPWEVPAANALLESKTLDEALASRVADRILQDAQPFAHNGYKIPIAHALVRRALMKLKG